jgi:hypothetical protein
MESRLLVFWMSKADRIDWSDTSRPWNIWRRIWLVEVPIMSLENEHVRYALLAISATQLSGRHPDDDELSLARHRYWSMALREQRTAITDSRAKLPEPLTIAAYLILLNSFAMLRTRDLQPYHAPTEWIQSAKGAWYICPPKHSIPPNSILHRIINITEPIWKMKSDDDDALGEPFESILRVPYSIEESECDRDVYRETCRLIAPFRRAIAVGKPLYEHVQRICIFPQSLPAAFVELLRKCRPRALVILAQFFVAVALSGALGLFGDTQALIPRREIQAIAGIIPREWSFYVDQCLSEVMSGTAS